MKKQFIDMFDTAKGSNSKYVFVKIVAVDAVEVIVIPFESFDAKKEFYKNAYADDLAHVMNDKVRITAFSHGNHTELLNHI